MQSTHREWVGAAPAVVPLGDQRAADARCAGMKASALARASSMGLPVLPGFVITTSTSRWLRTAGPAAFDGGMGVVLEDAYRSISEGGTRTVVVRSSSTAEDGADSSMAGMFTSVIGVRDMNSFMDAVTIVIDSARTPLATDPDAPMAILVQQQLEPRASGVLFCRDPITGRKDRIIVAAVTGSPERLVGGEVDGVHYTLSRQGRLIESDEGDERLLSSRDRRALAALARRVTRTFGEPQDVEWAFDANGKLWLFQSRPITIVGNVAKARGPVLGPGPVAETFPDALTTLEEDLWLGPLKDALSYALVLSGAASRRQIERSPVATSVGGRAAVDLRLIGALPKERSLLRAIDPRGPARRFAASWRVGRLRAALPTLATNLISSIDEELSSIPDVTRLPDARLLLTLDGCMQALRAVHGHEILTGLLLKNDGAEATTGAAEALRRLAHARAEGIPDGETIQRYPVVLSLVPPSITVPPVLPPISTALLPHSSGHENPIAVLREALRLRARLVHELSAVIARESARRLVQRGALASPEEIAHLELQELEVVLLARPGRTARGRRRSPASPLPAAFRLTPEGEVVVISSERDGEGQAAGGGRNTGRVVKDPGDVVQGDVLIVRTLDPGLAPLLPQLGGLISETGSPLSHLAILAREFEVPTVVAVRGALDRFDEGQLVTVDGTAGELTLVIQEEASR